MKTAKVIEEAGDKGLSLAKSLHKDHALEYPENPHRGPKKSGPWHKSQIESHSGTHHFEVGGDHADIHKHLLKDGWKHDGFKESTSKGRKSAGVHNYSHPSGHNLRLRVPGRGSGHGFAVAISKNGPEHASVTEEAANAPRIRKLAHKIHSMLPEGATVRPHLKNAEHYVIHNHGGGNRSGIVKMLGDKGFKKLPASFTKGLPYNSFKHPEHDLVVSVPKTTRPGSSYHIHQHHALTASDFLVEEVAGRKETRAMRKSFKQRGAIDDNSIAHDKGFGHAVKGIHKNPYPKGVRHDHYERGHLSFKVKHIPSTEAEHNLHKKTPRNKKPVLANATFVTRVSAGSSDSEISLVAIDGTPAFETKMRVIDKPLHTAKVKIEASTGLGELSKHLHKIIGSGSLSHLNDTKSGKALGHHMIGQHDGSKAKRLRVEKHLLENGFKKHKSEGKKMHSTLTHAGHGLTVKTPSVDHPKATYHIMHTPKETAAMETAKGRAHNIDHQGYRWHINTGKGFSVGKHRVETGHHFAVQPHKKVTKLLTASGHGFRVKNEHAEAILSQSKPHNIFH